MKQISLRSIASWRSQYQFCRFRPLHDADHASEKLMA
jgi:hypothetical protein